MTKPTAGSSLWRTSRPPGHHCNHSVDTGISASIGAAPPFCSGVCSCSRSWGIFAPTPRRRWRMGSDMSMSMYPFVGRWMYHIDKRYTTIGLGRYIYWGWSTGRGERDTQQSNNRRGCGLNYLSGGYNRIKQGWSDGWHYKDTCGVRQHNATINYDTVCQRRCRRCLYCMGVGISLRLHNSSIHSNNYKYIYARRPPFDEDGRQSTRTHTTTNQIQAVTLDDSKERWCGHCGGEDLSFWQRYQIIINIFTQDCRHSMRTAVSRRGHTQQPTKYRRWHWMIVRRGGAAIVEVRIYCLGNDIIGRGRWCGHWRLNNIVGRGGRQSTRTHTMRTHTTTNQEQMTIMEGRRERWCGHRVG